MCQLKRDCRNVENKEKHVATGVFLLDNTRWKNKNPSFDEFRIDDMPDAVVKWDRYFTIGLFLV